MARRTKVKKKKDSFPPDIERVSLVYEYTRCGKPNCHCKTSRGHGPYWKAYWKAEGKTRSGYIGKELPDELKKLQKQRPSARTEPAEEERVGHIRAAYRKNADIPQEHADKVIAVLADTLKGFELTARQAEKEANSKRPPTRPLHPSSLRSRAASCIDSGTYPQI